VRGFQPLIGHGVELRALVPSEAGVVIRYRRDPRVARFQGWGVVDPGEIERDIAAMVGRTPCDVPGPWLQLAIVERVSGAIAGDLGVRLLADAADTAEVGYTVAPAFQRLGYASEAVRLMCAWLLGPRELARVLATIDSRNVPSIGVVERTGFARIACIETRAGGAPAWLYTYEKRR
jgi:RimJ/RimL family protein N-acetyltransferase